MTAPDLLEVTIEGLRKEALAWLDEHGPSGIMTVFPNRSCWHCNPGHDWMRTDTTTPYQCFECGHIYFKGVDITEPDAEETKP